MDRKSLIHLWMELPWYWDIPLCQRLIQLKRVLKEGEAAKEKLNELKLLPRCKRR